MIIIPLSTLIILIIICKISYEIGVYKKLKLIYVGLSMGYYSIQYVSDFRITIRVYKNNTEYFKTISQWSGILRLQHILWTTIDNETFYILFPIKSLQKKITKIMNNIKRNSVSIGSQQTDDLPSFKFLR